MEDIEDKPELRSATEEPATVKELMVRAMASNECMGIVQAAISAVAEAGWHLTRMLHENWLEEDEDYARIIQRLEEVGRKAQKEGVLMSALSMMADDAQILKWMLQNFSGISSEGKPQETGKKSRFEELTDEEVVKLWQEMQKKNLKVV